MNCKLLIGFLVAITVGVSPFSLLAQVAELPWNSILPEIPETHAIATLLKVYNTYDANGPILLYRLGRANDGGYVIPVVAMKSADVVIGYGINDDISFEDSATALYEKPSYGFDCTSRHIRPTQRKCHFIPSCVVSEQSTTSFLSHGTFDQHLHLIGAADKKIFLKMDIEGGEYDVISDVLQHAHNITGIVLEVHFNEPQQISQAEHLLQMLNKDFFLVHVHGNNCCRDVFITSNAKGFISRVLELSYIHRQLVNNHEISSGQTHPTLLDMPNSPDLPDIEFTIFQ